MPRLIALLSLICLVLTGLWIGLLIIVCRPLIELTFLSDHYAAATDPSEKLCYLAAGEVLPSSLDGTAWMGIINSAIALGFFLPTSGLLFLVLNTIGSVPWCLLVTRDLFKIAQTTPSLREASHFLQETP